MKMRLGLSVAGKTNVNSPVLEEASRIHFSFSLSLSGKLSSLSVKTRCQTQNRASFETITGQDKGESVPKTWAFVRREHGRQASFDDEEKKCVCSRSTIKHLGVSMARQTTTIFPPPEILKTCTARI